MAGAFKLITDEHWSDAHVKAAREKGWHVVRVVDILGLQTPDLDIMAYCEANAYVWITRDKRAQIEIKKWIAAGRALPGVIIGVEHRRRIAPGRFVRFLESLATEEAPFAGVIRFLTPEEK